jgi:hypothetical protein
VEFLIREKKEQDSCQGNIIKTPLMEFPLKGKTEIKMIT